LAFERAAALSPPDDGGVRRNRRISDAHRRAIPGRWRERHPEKKRRSHTPIRLFTFSRIAAGAAITSFARASNSSPVDIDLAVERGEVQCRAFTVSTYFAREPFITWRKKNFVRVLYQTGNIEATEKRKAKLQHESVLVST
jgi:hypothetical protein